MTSFNAVALTPVHASGTDLQGNAKGEVTTQPTCLDSAIVQGPVVGVAIIRLVKDIALLPWGDFDVSGVPDDGQPGLASCCRIHDYDDLYK